MYSDTCWESRLRVQRANGSLNRSGARMMIPGHSVLEKVDIQSKSALRVRLIIIFKTFYDLRPHIPKVHLGLALIVMPSHLSFSCFLLRSEHKRTEALAMGERFLGGGKQCLVNSKIEDCH